MRRIKFEDLSRVKTKIEASDKFRTTERSEKATSRSEVTSKSDLVVGSEVDASAKNLHKI